MSALSLQATIREKTGKGPARTLRREGLIPAIIYGKGHKEVMISVVSRDIEHLYSKFAYLSTPVEIDLAGKKHHVLPKAVLKHPVTDKVEHADFVFLNKGERVSVKVPLLFTGREKSLGLKRGGVLNIVLRNLILTVDANDIPNVVEVDISTLEIGAAIRFKDIVLPKNAKSNITDPNYTIAKVVGKKAAKEEDESAATAATGDAAKPGAAGKDAKPEAAKSGAAGKDAKK
jgi:large subunit ribosomal protein L25